MSDFHYCGTSQHTIYDNHGRPVAHVPEEVHLSESFRQSVDHPDSPIKTIPAEKPTRDAVPPSDFHP